MAQEVMTLPWGLTSPGPRRVEPADRHAIQAEAVGQVVHLRLDGERALEIAVAPHGARVGIVGVDDGGVEAHRGDSDRGPPSVASITYGVVEPQET